MAKGSEITLAYVQTRLGKIKAAAAKPPEDPIYEYLHSLYRLQRQFGEPKEGEIRKFFDAEYEKLNHKKIQYTFFRVMVQLTMPPGTAPQYRSRYANALQYAFDKKIHSKNVVAFMKEKGGYKKCDELYRGVLLSPKSKKSKKAQKKRV